MRNNNNDNNNNNETEMINEREKLQADTRTLVNKLQFKTPRQKSKQNIK